MPDLIAKSPLAGRPSLTIGAVTLSETRVGPITSVAAFAGQDKAVAVGLKAFGLTFPAPNRFTEKGPARLVWTGRDQAFLIGVAPDGLAAGAAVTDQSDGWACLRLDGAGAEAVLARIVPIDTRLAAFPKGHAARTPFNHMSSILMRVGPATFDILIFRSMARTAWHEVETAMAALAARAVVG